MVYSLNVLATELPKKDDLRLSTWYWLNSIEKEKWEQDFQAAAKAGFTDLILCWGLDAAAVLWQKENTSLALELCHKHGLKAYLCIWHPMHNSLPREAEFQQVDNKGNLLYSFNLFHRKWRATQWRNYLQNVAKAYKDKPAFAGYLFDDSFELGFVGSYIKKKKDLQGDFVSYSAYDMVLFRQWLESKYQTLMALNTAWKTELKSWENIEPPREISLENKLIWQDWCEARRTWLREWAEDTVKFVREVDGITEHEIYVEDGQYVLGLETRSAKASFRPITIKDTVGVEFGYVMQPFDAVCGYTYFSWGSEDSLQKAIQVTQMALQLTRAQLGKDKKIIYTFWAADIDIDKPIPLNYPTAEQILAITNVALSQGIRHIDYYGFRIGDWRVSETEWVKMRPTTTVSYPVTKPLSQRFLCDRPDVLKVLAEKHAELKTRPTADRQIDSNK